MAAAAAGIVVVSLHAGLEYTDDPHQEQRDLVRAAIDVGALLVLGHHPHVLQGWERYGNGLIVFSLGNFVFDLDSDDLATLRPRPLETIALRVELMKSGVLKATALPVLIDTVENRPLLPDAERGAAIRQRLDQLSEAFR